MDQELNNQYLLTSARLHPFRLAFHLCARTSLPLQKCCWKSHFT